METVVLVVHLLIALALIGVVLVQKSEGGGLGMGGGSTMGGLMSVRGTGNLLTRTTAILAAVFMVTSLSLAIMAGSHGKPQSLIDTSAPVEQPAAQPASPPPPSVPAVPVAK
ncbi:MAG: preprotein translocase subunit SecG [Azospirillaceae bacterium]|nr:preprotein translocase subunit SecG [Azospirillaceae bacterium]